MAVVERFDCIIKTVLLGTYTEFKKKTLSDIFKSVGTILTPITLLACLFTVTRIQFYAVEIARNRRGLNKHFLEKSISTEDSHER